MLKLLKHDIKDSYLEIVILNGILLGLAFVAFLSVKLLEASGGSFLLVLSLFAWVITLAASVFVVFNSIIKSFHKKLFTDCGYLTLTTPVSVDKILFSKIIVNMIWIATTVISVFLSVLIVVSSFTSIQAIPLFFMSMREHPVSVLTTLVLFIVKALESIVTLIFVLVLTNIGRMKKHKMLKGLLIFMGVFIVLSVVNPFNSSVTGDLSGKDPIISETGDYIMSLVLDFAICVGFYFISRFLIIHKLELE